MENYKGEKQLFVTIITDNVFNTIRKSYFQLVVMPQRSSQKEPTNLVSTTSTCSEFNFEDVCSPGNTLLWDLVQDDKAVGYIYSEQCCNFHALTCLYSSLTAENCCDNGCIA